MKIRKADEGELKELVGLYKEAFEVHNIFEKSYEEVLEYLENVEGEFIVAVDDGKVVGGLLVVRKDDKSRIKHFAVRKEYRDKGVGSALLETAENMIVHGKVEIHVGELEKDAIEFYEKNGYKIEKELKDYYREGEVCYMLGKVLK